VHTDFLITLYDGEKQTGADDERRYEDEWDYNTG
jgi:hypothetical protein